MYGILLAFAGMQQVQAAVGQAEVGAAGCAAQSLVQHYDGHYYHPRATPLKTPPSKRRLVLYVLVHMGSNRQLQIHTH